MDPCCPDCGSRECGVDPVCGASCGECTAPATCSADGQCQPGQCQLTNGGLEACDTVDNDCDGLTDEAFPRLGAACQNAGCAPGQWVCAADGERDECDGPVPSLDDAACDGLDEDCDGATDEDALPRACPLQLGVCAGALTACWDGDWLPCDYGAGYVADLDARCDQLDEDCDGATDEDASFVLAPEAGAQAADGVDNNCNGLTDESGGVMVPNRNYPNSWIDAYELTVFENPDCSGARFAEGSDDYPATWPAGEGASTELYACSLPGLVPSGYLSWNRAQRACQAQGKQLCNREMFVRACTDGLGQFFPYGFSFSEGLCNDPMVGPLQAAAAGSYPTCAVGNGTFDMSGNLAEWVSDDSLSHPGQGVLASWSFDRRICWEGVGCYTADPSYQQDRDYLISLLDCDVENTVQGLDSYPRETARASFGGRCCIEQP
ncbi:MAG TPA: MopE-related protein [Verrucomicrobiota bacterium]|nr:MopE-related protein [Verrucomicrobiota bacterium]